LVSGCDTIPGGKSLEFGSKRKRQIILRAGGEIKGRKPPTPGWARRAADAAPHFIYRHEFYLY